MAAPMDRDSASDSVKKKQRKTERKCLMHVKSISTEGAQVFTNVRWEKFRSCGAEWLKLDGDEREMAESAQALFPKEFDDLVDKDEIGFHPLCYRRFTDKSRIEQAKKRCAKKTKVPSSSSSTSSEGETGPSPKKLRSLYQPSASGSGSRPTQTTTGYGPSKSRGPSKSQSVLPEICIICRKKDKYITVSHKRQKEKLVQAETENAGQLRKAAELKADERILLHIRDKDCVAIEVRYHAGCYKTYTSFLSKQIKDPKVKSPELDKKYGAVYEEFRHQVIEDKIIKDQEIMRMTKLTQMFNHMILKTEGPQAGLPRTDGLKYRLKRDYPQLSFHSPLHKTKSEMVFVDTLPAESLMDNLPTSSSTETDDTDIEMGTGHQKPFPELNPTRTLYNASLIIRNSLRDLPGLITPWPPTADYLTPEACSSVVPVELFNFMAWCTGYSEEPDIIEKVQLPEFAKRKLLSICQDIVYFSSRGRKTTPKSLSLGLAIRHLTGSSQVLEIISRLGHCASKSSVIGFETSLAQLQMSRGWTLPIGFSNNVPTVLVWDNIDFCEETVSGKGTTHHTNGIMIQSSISVTAETHVQSLRKGIRSLKHTSTPIAPYHQTKRHGPENLGDTILEEGNTYYDMLKPARNLDLAYILSKVFTTDLNVLPGWTGFNTTLNMPFPSKSALHYLPVIEASPTEMSTVNAILTKSLDIAQNLGRDYIVVVFDQAIYAKAQQIRWTNTDLSEKLIIRLGEFHTSMSFIGVIGKLFKDGGLQDILIESGVITQGSINGIINGHHYNRSVRAHKTMFEALHRLRFQAYFDSLNEEKQNDVIDVLNLLKSTYPTNEFNNCIESESFTKVMTDYQKFVDEKGLKNPTFAYWNIYIELVQLLLLFIRATRLSDWNLHLSAIYSMLPWFFVADRQNYSRYLPAYWLEMIELPKTHPACQNEIFARGEWTVQRQTSHSFASIACDQAIEQTCNRDSKTKGGIIGITLNPGAVQRWILAQPHKAAITRQCELMAGMACAERKRKDLDKSRVSKDEMSVKTVMSTIDGMNNPFDSQSDNLECISSGVVASEDVKTDLLSSLEKGRAAVTDFIQDRLIAKKESIFSPIKSLKIKTFSNQIKTKQSKTSSGKELTLKNDRTFFARLLVIGQNRELDLKDILTYSLGPVSFPLASSDGSLAKTDKSSMMKILEGSVDNCLIDKRLLLDQKSCLIIDAMALIQSLSDIPDTFGELSDKIFTQLVSLARTYNSDRVDFVCDRYPPISIKNAERSRRAAGGTQKLHIYGKDQRTPKQWKKFLSVGDNKENLIEFLFTTWKEVSLSTLKTLQVYVCHGHECHLIKWDKDNNVTVVLPMDCLRCDHEEADTRLLLHAKHASELYNNLIVRSPDTDVFILAIFSLSSFPAATNIYFLTGVKNNKRIINVNTIQQGLGNTVSSALVGLHVFTGCDSTSAFYGKGKKKAYDLTLKKPKYVEMFSKFGEGFLHDSTLIPCLENFVSNLYGIDNDNVNNTRYKLFCSSTASEQSLPPTLDALTQHLKRANYQAAIYKRCLDPFMASPSPVGHGWEMKENELCIVWMTKKPAPEAILECLQCACKTGCKSGRCSCLKAKLKCTDLCKCSNCENVEVPESSSNDIDSDDSGSDDPDS